MLLLFTNFLVIELFLYTLNFILLSNYRYVLVLMFHLPKFDSLVALEFVSN